MSTNTVRHNGSARFVHRWQQWKVARERELVHPCGPLTLVSSDRLSGTPRAYRGVPGAWWHTGEAAHLDPGGAVMSVDGEPVTGVRRFELVDGGPCVRVSAGDVEVELVRRSGYLIRAHDPSAPALAAFAGVPTYDPDPAWLVPGRFEPDTGLVRFEHAGGRHALLAARKPTGAGLAVLFTDATSGVTTCAAGRALAVDRPADGAVLLDFNRATNLPCAFTDFASGPLPPAGNDLPFAVTAGERLPHRPVPLRDLQRSGVTDRLSQL